MKGKAMIPLVLGLAIGLLAVKLTVDAIKRAQGSNQAKDMIAVVRTRQDIPAFAEITKEMIEIVETGETLFAPAHDRIESLDQALGRVTGKAIPKNSPLLLSMLASEGTPAGMVGRIPAGFRAVSVKTDEVTGVAYQLQPGDWVDVIVVMDVNMGRGKKETIAEVILQHIQIAAIGRGTQSDTDSAAGRTKPAKSATLLVREQDVPKLHLAATRGKITLAMRGDDAETTTEGAFAKSTDLLSSLRSLASLVPKTEPRPTTARLRRPEPVEEEPHKVIVYRGSSIDPAAMSVEQITFANARSSRILEVSQGNPTRQSSTMGLSGSRTRPGATRQSRVGGGSGGALNNE